MSLNIYGSFGKASVDGLNVTIPLKAELSKKQREELLDLQELPIFHLVAEPANVKYEEESTIEDQQTRYHYFQDDKGVWQREEIEQTNLPLDGVPNYEKKSKTITADVVDDFLMSQKFEYDGDFDAKKALVKIADGYDYDEIAKELKTTTTGMLNELSKIRLYFAPFAAAWQEQKAEA